MGNPLSLEYSVNKIVHRWDLLTLKYYLLASMQMKELENAERHSEGDNLVLNEKHSREEEFK